MAEKKLTNEELDKVGLDSIEMSWENKQKLTALFHHYAQNKEALPASGVNDNGDAIPNLSLLSRLAKVIQGKQVFRRVFASDMLDAAIKKCGIEDLSKPDDHNETTIVRDHMQSSVDAARRTASDTDKKLKSSLVKVDALTDDNQRLKAENADLKAEVADLKSELTIAKMKAGAAEQRVVKGVNQERQSLKRVF
jgi:hypothetical protein